MTALSKWYSAQTTRFVPISLLAGLGIALYLMVSMLGKLSDIEQMLETTGERADVQQVDAISRSVDSEFGLVCYYTLQDINCIPWYYGLAPWEVPSSRPISLYPSNGGN